MKYILTAMLAIVQLLTFHAQDCQSSLTGTVTDMTTGETVFNAKVQIANTDRVAYSDAYGKYSFKGLCDGPIELDITHENAQEKVLSILINGNTEKDIKLDYHPEQLETVVVVGNAVIRKSKTAREQTITGKEIDKFSSASLGDALAQMSGVRALKTGKSVVKPVIQGLSGSRVPVLYNGVRMEDQEWGADHAPNIDLNSAGALTVIKGAAALQYGGDAIGGVVLVNHAKIPVKDTIYGKTVLSGSTNGRGGSVSSSLTKSFQSGWYINAQGTYKKFGDFEAPDYVLSNTGSNERAFSVNFGLNKFDYGFDVFYSSFNHHLGILRASSTGSVSDLVKALNSDRPLYIRDFNYELKPPRQKVQHHLARLRFFKYFHGLGKLSVEYGYQENDRLEYDIRRGAMKYRPSVDLNLKTHSASASFDFNAHNNRQLKVGIDGRYKKNFADPSTGVQRIIPDYHQYAFGAYAIGNYSFNANWLIEAGARYDFSRIDAMKYYNKTRWYNQGYDKDFSDIVMGDYGSQLLVHPIFNYSNISATAGLKYSFGPSYDFRFNYAMSNRAPNPSELFSDGLHHSSASIELGDLRMHSEHSQKVSLSLEKRRGDLTFTIAPFANYINGFINIEPTGLEQTVRGVFLRYNYQQVDARLLGLDVDVNYNFNPEFSYHGKLSMVDGKETDADRYLIAIPATNLTSAITYKYKDWHDLSLSLRGNAVFTKQHYPNDNFKIKVLENGSYHNTLVDISTPPSGYFLTSFDAQAIFHPFERGAMAVRLSVNNLFNVSYRDYLNRLRYFADNIGRNISLQIRLNY